MAARSLSLLSITAITAEAAQSNGGKRAITQVVDLLQSMLEKAKEEGDTERNLFAKYKCYCDTNEEEKRAEIKSLNQEIQMLENEIDEISADNGVLSKAVARLKADMEANQKARDDATGVRTKEKADYDALKLDLETAIGQMREAIKVLAEIGADQNLQASAGHDQFMAKGASLASLQSTVRKAFLAASSFVSDGQKKQVDAFLQAPFTGTYSAQSGEVVGILRNMKDTFEANLDSATASENTAIEAYDKFIANKLDAYDKMETSKNSKQGQLSANDSELSTKRGQLTTAQDGLESAEIFLNNLLEMCTGKAKQYEERTKMRANEEAAISEAIAILNSDAAFATFGTVSATKEGPVSFLQNRAVRRHEQGVVEPRRKAIAFLQKAAGAQGSRVLGRVVALLQANNPFAVVLEEIEKMIGILAAEEKADDEQKSWCDSARTETDASIVEKNGEITALNGEITSLSEDIEHPVTGLKVQISNTETSLEENHNSQVTETADRTADNLAYQKDVANLVEANALLTKAVRVLRAYYSEIRAAESGSLLQRKHKKQEPPSTWDDDFKGQSTSGGSAIDMLEFILKNTQTEETAAHEAEKTAQHSYEDSMQTLKDAAKTLRENLAGLKADLAKKTKELLEKEKNLKATVVEKESLEAYLVKIKPGCDFITLNIADRKGHRANEKAALESATNLLKESPAFKEAMQAAHEESLGKCKEICLPAEEDVKCKACLAETSVPGYCAGHPGTAGC